MTTLEELGLLKMDFLGLRTLTALSVNNFYIIDDAKQRDKMTEEFYSAVKKEIALYQDAAPALSVG